MSQYVFSIKLTPRGLHYCIAYPAAGGEAVAVSHYSYDNGNDAMNDVMEQLGIRTIGQAEQDTPGRGIQSAAAGGLR